MLKFLLARDTMHQNQWLAAIEDLKESGIEQLPVPSNYGQSHDFMVHRIVAAANVPGLENLTALDQLPPTGSFVVALPMKIEGGSGGPVRVIAFVPK